MMEKKKNDLSQTGWRRGLSHNLISCGSCFRPVSCKKTSLLFKERNQKLKNFKQGQEGQASMETAEQEGQQRAILRSWERWWAEIVGWRNSTQLNSRIILKSKLRNGHTSNRFWIWQNCASWHRKLFYTSCLILSLTLSNNECFHNFLLFNFLIKNVNVQWSHWQ